MPSEEDPNAVVLDAIKRRNVPGTEVRVSRTIPSFMDGELVVAEILQEGKRVGEQYYYAASYDHVSRAFTSMDELVLWLNQQQKSPSFSTSIPSNSILAILGRFETVSALIAIVITFTICGIAIFQLAYRQSADLRIPDILSNALTVILGFYFGSQVGKVRGAGAPSSVGAPSPQDDGTTG